MLGSSKSRSLILSAEAIVIVTHLNTITLNSMKLIRILVKFYELTLKNNRLWPAS